jgi:hypothetical protein
MHRPLQPATARSDTPTASHAARTVTHQPRHSLHPAIRRDTDSGCRRERSAFCDPSTGGSFTNHKLLGYPQGDTTAQYKTVYSLANLLHTQVGLSSNLDPETRYKGVPWFSQTLYKNPG